MSLSSMADDRSLATLLSLATSPDVPPELARMVGEALAIREGDRISDLVLADFASEAYLGYDEASTTRDTGAGGRDTN